MIKSENWPRDRDFEFHGWQDEIVIDERTTSSGYKEVVEWLYDNVHNTESNVCWQYSGGRVYRFRKAEDHVWFRLTWG